MINVQESKLTILWDSLGFCLCGNVEEIAADLLTFLKKIEKHEHSGYEDHYYMFLCYWTDSKRWTDHGTSARCLWLTDEGKRFMAELEEAIQEEIKLNEGEEEIK